MRLGENLVTPDNESRYFSRKVTVAFNFVSERIVLVQPDCGTQLHISRDSFLYVISNKCGYCLSSCLTPFKYGIYSTKMI